MKHKPIHLYADGQYRRWGSGAKVTKVQEKDWTRIREFKTEVEEIRTSFKTQIHYAYASIDEAFDKLIKALEKYAAW